MASSTKNTVLHWTQRNRAVFDRQFAQGRKKSADGDGGITARRIGLCHRFGLPPARTCKGVHRTGFGWLQGNLAVAFLVPQWIGEAHFLA
ncbi:hypothetical protein RvY_06767 [Ramazzottius varieornatus]|uniref:Uncharacterized protein n=1 Tax=Ramazzottius varieornatus TaxID=947166 RepID=A0A1D1V2K3_RAMVA|nr:hypothetical protein RvY_06767 [Ramazzottius varieornatus]